MLRHFARHFRTQRTWFSKKNTFIHAVAKTLKTDYQRSSNRLKIMRLVTGWTVRGMNPGGDEIFRTRPDRHWSPSSLLHSGYWIILGSKAAEAWRWQPTPTSAELKSTAVPILPRRAYMAC